MAKCMGAAAVFKVEKCTCPRELAQKVKSSLCGMPDVTIDSTGAEQSIQTGIYVSIKAVELMYGQSFAYKSPPWENRTFNSAGTGTGTGPWPTMSLLNTCQDKLISAACT